MLLKANYKKHQGTMFNITPENVVYVAQEGDYHDVYVDGRPWSMSFYGSSAVVNERFPNLVRAHRGYYINPEKVFSISHNADNMVTIIFKDNKELSFSRSKIMHQSLIDAVNNGGN